MCNVLNTIHMWCQSIVPAILWIIVSALDWFMPIWNHANIMFWCDLPSQIFQKKKLETSFWSPSCATSTTEFLCTCGTTNSIIVLQFTKKIRHGYFWSKCLLNSKPTDTPIWIQMLNSYLITRPLLHSGRHKRLVGILNHLTVTRPNISWIILSKNTWML